MSNTCMQETTDRQGRAVMRRLPHDVPGGGTEDPNDGYARCRCCGADVYVGTGLHSNLGVPLADAESEAKFLRSMRY